MYNLYGQYHTQTRELTPSEENFLDVFMKALYTINPSLHKNLSHMKRVGIFTWILGWGVFQMQEVYLKLRITCMSFKSKINCKTNKLNN